MQHIKTYGRLTAASAIARERNEVSRHAFDLAEGQLKVIQLIIESIWENWPTNRSRTA